MQLPTIDTNQLKQIILQQLPMLIEQHPQIQQLVSELAEHKRETQDKFYQMLNELKRDREAQSSKWEKYTAEQNRKWDEAKQEFQQMHQTIMAIAQKQERHLGAIGARWGMQSESTFRQALAGILEQNFGVQVLNINEYDDDGIVFGRPDQVELDVIIKNGLLIICELKSSIDKAGMYIFERKVRFYEQRHHRQATRMIVISPMVDFRAKPVAEQLGIEVYSDSLDVKPQ
jgi:hypothetical protein